MAHKVQERPAATPLSQSPDEALEAVRQALVSMRYGAIALTVHDARIVQMEVTEKRRF